MTHGRTPVAVNAYHATSQGHSFYRPANQRASTLAGTVRLATARGEVTQLIITAFGRAHSTLINFSKQQTSLGIMSFRDVVECAYSSCAPIAALADLMDFQTYTG